MEIAFIMRKSRGVTPYHYLNLLDYLSFHALSSGDIIFVFILHKG
jgi:hypothetical protein